MRAGRAIIAPCVGCLLWSGHGAVAQETGRGVGDHGFEWALVGDPDNRGTNADELPFQPDRNMGGVPYKYRIMLSLVTMAEYEEFADAYGPYMDFIFPDWPGFTTFFASRDQLPNGEWGGDHAARGG